MLAGVKSEVYSVYKPEVIPRQKRREAHRYIRRIIYSEVVEEK